MCILSMSAFQDFKMMTQKNVSIKYGKVIYYHYLHSVHFSIPMTGFSEVVSISATYYFMKLFKHE